MTGKHTIPASDRKDENRVDLSGLTGLLGYQIRQAQTASFRDLQQSLGPAGITPGEFGLLTIVRDNPQIRQTDLVKVYGLDKSTLSVAVKRLVGRGLVLQRQLPDDRRNHGLSLTGEGEKLLSAVTGIVEAQESRMADVLAPGELDILMKALHRIADTLNRH